MHPAFVFVPGATLTLAELCAARLDGDVIEFGEGYIPADLVEGPALRALAVAAVVPVGTAAAGPTAAWILGAGDTPPSQHHVQRTSAQRRRLNPDRRLILHERRLAASDICTIGGVQVTTAARTMCDLLFGVWRDPALFRWAVLLAAEHPSSLENADHVLAAARRVPGRRGALDALARLRQDEVTRYTS